MPYRLIVVARFEAAHNLIDHEGPELLYGPPAREIALWRDRSIAPRRDEGAVPSDNMRACLTASPSRRASRPRTI